MASLWQVVGSITPVTPQGSEFGAVCPFEPDGRISVIGERWLCVAHGCHERHGADALGFLRCAGVPEDTAKERLANGHDWEPTLTLPEIPPSPYALARLQGMPLTGRVLVVDSRKAARRAEELLRGHYTALVAWPDGGERWELEPLRGREVLLWPGASADAFKRLEAVIADPAGLACTGRVVPDIDLTTWTGTRDELIAAARYKRRDITIPEIRTLAPESVVAQLEPPPVQDTDFPPEASQERPKRPPRRLRVVGGSDIPDPEEAPLPEAMSEDALADAFAEECAQDWRYVKEWDRWFNYDGDGWRPDKTELIDRLAVLLCRKARTWSEAASLSPEAKRRISQRRTAGQVRDMARNDRRLAASAEQWDTDPYLLGCPGGAIDLRTGKLVEGDRDAYITMRVSVAPERGEPSLWLAHLNTALQGNADTIAFLRRYLGYLLTGSVQEHCLVFFYGTGRNGKGTIVETVIKLLGDYGHAAPMNLLMESKSERHPAELAALRGKRAVSASEPPEGARWDDGRIRWLTGGDTITARGMRQDFSSFQPTHKLLLMGNHTPSLRSVDEAIRARFRVIEFNHFFKPEDRDPLFMDKLREEWPRILQWMIEGCLEWQDAGLGLPEGIDASTNQYLQAEDEFSEWILDCCEVDATATVKASEAYANFRTWGEKRGSYVPSQKAFSNKLRDRGYASIRTATARLYKGFSLKLGAGL